MAKVLKSLQTGRVSTMFEQPTDDELAIINSRALRPFDASELVCLTVHVANNLKDKVCDILSDNFMYQFAEQAAANNLKGQLNHSEDVTETWANIFKAQVVLIDETTKEIEARAYVVLNDDTRKILDKIEAGVIGDISISFNGEGHYDNNNGTFVWDECTVAREWSLVVCPCQSGTGISKDLNGKSATVEDKVTDVLSNGGKSMKKKDYFLSKLFKRLKSAPADSSEEISQLIDSIESSEENDEFTQEDIEALLKERDDLKDEIERLKAELAERDAELKACKEAAEEQIKEAETAAIEEALKACVDKACPMNQTVAEDMLKSFDRSQLSMDAGVIKGLDEQEAAVLKRYEGLYGKKFSTPSASKELPKVSFGKKVDVTNTKKSFNDRVNAMVENN